MLDLGTRPEEVLTLWNANVDWHAHRLTFFGTKVENETRIVPFNPKGRVAEILKRRRFAGSTAPIICDHEGHQVKKVYRAWVHAVCIAFNIPFRQTKSGGRPTKDTLNAYKALKLVPYSLRHEFATWAGLCGVSDETAEFMQGHARQTTHARYKHEKLMRATNEVSEKLWPRETERARFDKKMTAVAG